MNRPTPSSPPRVFLHVGSPKTGDRTYCFVGKWDKFESIVAARPTMIGFLDEVRPYLEDLGNGLGVTDPVSGTVVAERTS